MTEQYILVIDAGTSALRCHLFNSAGRSVALQSRPWPYAKVEDASDLAREFDTKQVWMLLCGALQSLLKDVHLNRVEAVGITSQRQGVAFLDKDGHELYAGPNIDLRAVFEGAAIDEDHADDVYAITGHLPSFFFTPAKLRWFQTHQPGIYERIAVALPLADWVAYKLTGNLASERSLAGEAGHLDIHHGVWASTLPEQLGLAVNSGLRLMDPMESSGGISTPASQQTGLMPNTPVFVCGADTQAGLLGLGAWNPGDVGVVAGWSAPIQMITTKPVLSPDAATWAGCYLAPSRWVLESSAGDIGNGYSWLVNTLWQNRPDAFEQADAAASVIPPGAEGTLAVLGPPRMDMRHVGLHTGGLLFPTPVTLHEKSPGHLVRGVLEAASYTIRANLEQVETLSKTKASTIALGGGMSRSEAFVRVLADVLGRNVLVAKETATSALGAYFYTTTALGHYDSLAQAAASARDRLEIIELEEDIRYEYDEYYINWLDAAEKLKRIAL
ncbi:MAG: FGGY-family carbohydrate kinase [Chloroflexi bacterium]|nr:FGGY-family carbohydrate kinase [Chloroflexota bacterium]